MRVWGQLLSFIATAVLLVIDLQGVELGGHAVPWQIPALISLSVFAALVYWHMYSLNHQVHSPERHIDLVLRPDSNTPAKVSTWHAINQLTPGMYTTYTHVSLDVRSSDANDRTINELYVEIWTARHILLKRWVLPLVFQRRIVEANPIFVDGDIHWHENEFPKRVDWPVPGAGRTVTHRVRFERTWQPLRENIPAPPNRCTSFLVAEVGGKEHKRRWDIVKEVTGRGP